MVVQALMIEAGIAAVGKLTDAIADSVAFYDDAQKASLTLGMTYGETMTRLEGSMDGLRGSFETKLAGGFELLSVGFQGNIGGMSLLMNQQKVLGGNSKKTATVMANLQGSLGVTNDGLNTLSVDLLSTANRYGITTDKLVAGLEGLSRNFPVMLAAELNTQEILRARNIIDAKSGGKLTDQINSMFNALLDPSQGTAQKLIAGGMMKDLNAMISKGATTQTIIDSFQNIIQKGEAETKRFSMDGLGMFGKVGIAMGIFGKDFSVGASQLSKSLDLNSGRILNLDQVDYGNTLQNRFAEVFNPLKEITSNIAVGVTGTQPESLMRQEVHSNVSLSQITNTQTGPIVKVLGKVLEEQKKTNSIGAATLGSVDYKNKINTLNALNDGGEL